MSIWSTVVQERERERESLPHVLNNCPVAMDLRRYSKRHDEVLEVLGNSIRTYLPPNFSITIDSPSNSFSFSHHITPTNLRLDLVWWSEQLSELWLFELIFSYETVVADARERKHSKYHDLMEAGRAAGFRCELISLEVGSRGMLSLADLEPLQDALEIPRKDLTNLALMVICTTILESFRIWSSRNYTTRPSLVLLCKVHVYSVSSLYPDLPLYYFVVYSVSSLDLLHVSVPRYMSSILVLCL